jgi:hypothetical protein
VTNQQYRCFYPGHSFRPNEALTPIQVNWYEALAYAAYHRGTLPSKVSVEVEVAKGTPEKTWCENMNVARDEKQASLLSAASSYRSASPCLAKGRSALLEEKRKFKVYFPSLDDVVQ